MRYAVPNVVFLFLFFFGNNTDDTPDYFNPYSHTYIKGCIKPLELYLYICNMSLDKITWKKKLERFGSTSEVSA